MLNISSMNLARHQPPMEYESLLQYPCDESQISPPSLLGLFSPPKLELIGYIKHFRVIVLIDNGSTDNFIHKRVAHETHCYVHPISNFQIMISNGGTMKFRAQCESMKL
jgi:hypothetical protein